MFDEYTVMRGVLMLDEIGEPPQEKKVEHRFEPTECQPPDGKLTSQPKSLEECEMNALTKKFRRVWKMITDRLNAVGAGKDEIFDYPEAYYYFRP